MEVAGQASGWRKMMAEQAGSGGKHWASWWKTTGPAMEIWRTTGQAMMELHRASLGADHRASGGGDAGQAWEQTIGQVVKPTSGKLGIRPPGKRWRGRRASCDGGLPSKQRGRGKIQESSPKSNAK
ncbi:hypothetical protein Dimus_016271, partial [Dionaea muscipula]